jgi:hypothetical protein
VGVQLCKLSNLAAVSQFSVSRAAGNGLSVQYSTVQ